MKKYFSIIQSLCRSIVNCDKELAFYQVERLANALKKDGFEKESQSLLATLRNAEKHQSIEPQQLSVSSIVSGEELYPNTPIPVDKETAAPILEVIFPQQLDVQEPLFEDSIRNAINSVILEWTHYGLLLQMKAKPSRSCLIFGKPGTGKTHMAKWMAKCVGLPIVTAKLDGIVSSFLGTSSRNISNLFSFANRYKCVLLLDEFDAIAKLRDDPQEVGEVKRIVNTLLQCLDERSSIGFTIGITNHEQLLDPAIWRRFDIQIEIPTPSNEVRMKLLEHFLRPITITDANVKFICWCMQGASGADIENLTNWIKRMKIISKNEEESVINMMRRYSLLNNGRINEEVKRLLELPNDEVCVKLMDAGISMRQKDIAEVLCITPSSLSKQISKFKKV